MLRVMTMNLNGIRSATTKGFFTWFLEQNVDVLCLQEVRALREQIHPEIAALPGYYSYFLPAEKKGYSGVAIYSRAEPDNVVEGMDHLELQGEGRLLRADFRDLSITSLYAPSGTSGELRQGTKDRFLVYFREHIREMQLSGRRHILCGDFNIAHKQIDIKNWKSNQASSGFLPHERAWMDDVIDSVGMIDAFRKVDMREDQFTWWSTRAGARAKNIGWRIDYQLATSNLAETIRSARIDPTPHFSDHAPLTVDYSLS